MADWSLGVLSFGQRLEDDVERSLVLVTLTLVFSMVLANAWRMRSRLPQVVNGMVALAVGTAVFHIVIVLFGAPVNQCDTSSEI